MGQTETAFIKAYNDSNTQPFDVALNRLWKRLDKKPCCGSLGKKDTIKFLNSVCELCEKEKRNWPSDVGPSLREGIVEKWYKSLDPPNSKIVSWEDVLRAIGSSEAKTVEQDYKALLLAHRKVMVEHMEFKEEISLLRGALSITQHQLKGKKDRKRRRDKLQKQKQADGKEAEEAVNSSESESATASSSEEEYEEPKEEVQETSEKESEKDTLEKSGSATSSTTKKSVLGEDMIQDIIYCIEKSFEKHSFDVNSPDYEMITPKEYLSSDQFMEHRIPDQLLKFKDFAPKVFHQIRGIFQIDEKEIVKSFRADNLTAIKGEGKSGAFLLISKDHRFILKTATMEERDYLWEILPYYLQHVKTSKDTLLPRILCVFSMKHEGIGGVTRFFIMNNVFNSNIYYDPLEKFDLKGSTSGRYVPERKMHKISTLKDKDILKRKRKLYIPESIYNNLMKAIESDSKFLSQFDIMDYSLLVGIHYETPDNKETLTSRRLLQCKRKPEDRSNTFYESFFQRSEGGIMGYNADEKRVEFYYIGIIDILMQYTARKKAEHFFRAIGGSGDELSTVPPGQYQSRFVKFMQQVFVKIPDSSVPVNTMITLPTSTSLELGSVLRSPRSIRTSTKSSADEKKAETPGSPKRDEKKDGKGKEGKDKEKLVETPGSTTKTETRSDSVASTRTKRDTKTIIKSKKK